MKKFIPLLFLSILPFHSFVKADVLPSNLTNGSTYVRITVIDDTQVVFDKCAWNQLSTPCQRIGRTTPYTLNELRQRRSGENQDVLWASVFNATTIAFGGWTCGLADLAITGVIDVAGTIIGSALGATALSILEPFSLFTQIKQVRTIREALITDEEEVVVGNISKFITRLEVLLKKLEPQEPNCKL